MQVRRWFVAGGTAFALVAAGGCGIAGAGVQVTGDGGDATTSPAPDSQTDTAEGEAFSLDPIEVLREDPDVRQDIKDLFAQPCFYESGSWFPVDTVYATIAGTDIQVAVIDVLGCTEPNLCASGYASYIYRLGEDGTEQVYAAEETTSSIAVVDGEFTLEWSVWEPGDETDCPTGLDSMPLIWDGDEFVPGGE
ncbi:hypothetical protein [Glycomyces buryatensis]|uniref:LppP/LprE family lipoprotein n=1 Tax=Glycomyces buryatensis TaxID=2570927 RepID=A0A4S8Q9S2_9ACTN|nr:hypothetical protein [Glycomyces buryatensis]THV37094.1 hypothetical protein FAB82_21365 [Glycomyces buryatensis]